jgi:hypothetical protein
MNRLFEGIETLITGGGSGSISTAGGTGLCSTPARCAMLRSMDMQTVAGRLESALTDEFDQVGVAGAADIGLDEDTIIISLSGEQAQALLDALNRAEDKRRT